MVHGKRCWPETRCKPEGMSSVGRGFVALLRREDPLISSPAVLQERYSTSQFQKAAVSVLSVTLSLGIGVCPGEAA